jgi:HSP20 family protein
MSELYSGTDPFSEFDRLQRQMASLFGGFPSSIRAGRLGAFPQINIGATDDSIEIVAFAPGVSAAGLDVGWEPQVTLDDGLHATACYFRALLKSARKHPVTASR